MEHNHDFQADNKFFIENYAMLLNLHAGKTVAIARNKVLFVADSHPEAISWADRFCMAGLCSILDVSPKTYSELTEGIRI